MSNIDAQLMNEDQSKEHYDLPNFQLLASYMSFELKGTVGLKNGLKIIYAFESRTSGKTRRVPWVGAVSLDSVNYLLFIGQQICRSNIPWC